MLRKHAFDETTKRRLFSLALPPLGSTLDPSLGPLLGPSLGPLLGPSLGSRHFACLLAWDARGASAEAVSSLATPLLRAGASYVACWGPDCERVHDIVDECLSDPTAGLELPPEGDVMTSWHADDPLREAIWFFLRCSAPYDSLAASTRAGLAVSVGSPAWATEIAAALDDPAGFVSRVPDDEA